MSYFNSLRIVTTWCFIRLRYFGNMLYCRIFVRKYPLGPLVGRRFPTFKCWRMIGFRRESRCFPFRSPYFLLLPSMAIHFCKSTSHTFRIIRSHALTFYLAPPTKFAWDASLRWMDFHPSHSRRASSWDQFTRVVRRQSSRKHGARSCTSRAHTRLEKKTHLGGFWKVYISQCSWSVHSLGDGQGNSCRNGCVLGLSGV